MNNPQIPIPQITRRDKHTNRKLIESRASVSANSTNSIRMFLQTWSSWRAICPLCVSPDAHATTPRQMERTLNILPDQMSKSPPHVPFYAKLRLRYFAG